MTGSIKLRLLLVDDDNLVLEALNELFCDKYETFLAASGAEAIEAVRRHPDISAVVLDMKMGQMDGIATYQAIRELAPAMPILIHTGNPAEYLKRFGGIVPTAMVIQKGHVVRDLVEAVDRACSGN